MQHEFTGVFIPAHIWLSPDLSPAEKMMLGEVDALSRRTGWCTAGRQHFATWLHCTLPNVTYYTRRLEEMGFLEIVRDAGGASKMRVVGARFYENSQGSKESLPVNPINGGSKHSLRGVVNTVNGGSKERLPEIEYKENIKLNFKGGEEESAFHAQLNTENTFEQNGASPAAPARKAPTKTQPKAQPETPQNTHQNTDPNKDQNTLQNTSPAARLRTAITESMSWIQESTDIVRDWFMLSKQTPPANNADIPAHLQDQVVSFFSYYQQQGNERAINKPVDFLQTSFIRWMVSNRERVSAQAAQSDRMDKGQTGNAGQNKAASAQQTDAAPLAHIPWV